MAYNIASMIEILEQDQHHLHLACNNQLDNFLEKARSFRDVILRIPCYAGRGMDDDFTGEAHVAEDFIETHIRNRVLLVPDEDDDDDEFDSMLDYLSNHVQEFESTVIRALEIMNYDAPEQQPDLPVEHLTSEQVPWYPKLDPCARNDIPAIFKDEFQTLKAKLIEGPSKLQIISINGIPGMGKMTLARRLYNDPLVAAHFRTRAWVTSPSDINERSCLLNLIEGLGKLTIDMQWKDVDELKVYIRNTLRDTKYFIVIPNVLGTQNFVVFTRLFRDYHVGARVLITPFAIDEEVLSTYTEPYHMRILTDDESWLLLRHKVFGREYCPNELEPIGKNIMQLCKGSPQAVSLAAGVLATSEKTSTTWELVATTMSQFKSLDTEQMLFQLLDLIYYHMPHYLRPCFLYIGAFYESRDIKASKIIKLWIAEGFIKQRKGKCLEDVAETYLGILIDKNLLHLTHQEPNGRIKAFHHQLSLKSIFWLKSYRENFLGSTHMNDFLEATEEECEEKLVRRVSAHGLSKTGNEVELQSLTRSFLSTGGALGRQIPVFLKLRLLRVLEVFQMEFHKFPMEIMQQVLLRYLAISCHSNLPSSFSILRNLQTIVVRRLPEFRAFSLPSDLWELTQLRHVKCKETFVLIYPKNVKEIVHRNLQTLSNMQLFGVRNQFLKQTPNLKNLGIFCNITMETTFDLESLDKLETLKCSTDWSLASRNFLEYLTIPQSLRKLNLSLCRIPSEFMKLVGSLPVLEILKLQKSDFLGVNSTPCAPEWEIAEGDFPQLVSLEMLDLNLVHWRAKSTQLPRLKHLVILNCYAMVEIPLDIGNIQTLELIHVNKASPFALVSAMQIKKEQEGRGNQLLQVRTHTIV